MKQTASGIEAPHVGPASRPRVTVLGPGPFGMGGITSVIKVHQKSAMWKEFRCVWISTYVSACVPRKVMEFCWALLRVLFVIPRTDVFHIHASLRTSLLRKTIFVGLAKLFRKKVILHCHAPELTFLETSHFRRVLQWSIRSADVVVALSGNWVSKLTRYSRNVIVIPNPVLTPVRGVDFGKERRRPIGSILFLGKLEPRKGYKDLIHAFELVRKSVPCARLVMAGNGDIAGAQLEAHRASVADSIYFPGWVDDQKKAELLADADVFCLPSFAEGLPISVLEAMASGVPVVCTGVGGLRDLVVDGKNALVAQPGNPADIASAIVRVLRDKCLANRLAEAGRGTAAAQANAAEIEHTLVRVYLELIPRYNP